MKRLSAPIIKLLLAAAVGCALSACVIAPAPPAYYAPGYAYYGPGPGVQFDYYGSRPGYRHW
jgi:hypothetical protein